MRPAIYRIDPESNRDRRTPYGPSHVAGSADDKPISTDEAALCRALGARLATAAEALSGNVSSEQTAGQFADKRHGQSALMRESFVVDLIQQCEQGGRIASNPDAEDKRPRRRTARVRAVVRAIAWLQATALRSEAAPARVPPDASRVARSASPKPT